MECNILTKFVKVSETHTVRASRAVNVPAPKLCFYIDKTKYAIPLSSTNENVTVTEDDDLVTYYYNNMFSFNHSRYLINGLKYSAPVTSVDRPAYQIPAGTYTPSTFRSMLTGYLNSGNAKMIDNTVTFTQNGKTWTVNANSGYIRRRDWNSGGTTAEQDVITFNQTSQPSGATPGTCIILYSNPTFSSYNSYPITVSAGFNFV